MVAIGVGLALIVVFGTRAWHQVRFMQRVDSGDVQVETLRGWMTLAYIERIHGVPEAELRRALDLPATGHDDRSLRDWFDAARIEPAAGRRTLESLILARRRVGPGPVE